MLSTSIRSGLVGLLLAGVLAGCNEGDAGGDVTGTGTITISVENWSGVEGYRLLAVAGGYGNDLGGGAFWTLIDSDPFSAEDVVHPPFLGEDVVEVDVEDWGTGDYLWEETARLEPGTYRIDFWANPGNVAPYGSHIPASPIERQCWADVEVRAGEVSTIVISGIPKGAGRCPEIG
jgi:hypothetical protein